MRGKESGRSEKPVDCNESKKFLPDRFQDLFWSPSVRDIAHGQKNTP